MKVFSKKKFLFVNHLSNRGFTLVEMLYSLSIFCIIISFIPLTFQAILKEEPIHKRLQRLEWEVFLSQFKKELRMCDQIIISNNKIYLWKNEQIIVYEKYGSNIRRRVNLSGHEIVLQKVESATFYNIKNGVQIILKDEYGQWRESSIRSFLDISS